MNPKIAVDAKNKAIASLTGLVTVGAKVDVEITGLPDGIPDWAATDKFAGKSLRFRVVDETGRDLVRFPLVEKSGASATDGDKWTHVSAAGTTPETYKTNDGTNTTPVVNFDTDVLRKAMHGVPFDAYREFGVILDSIVDAAQYAIGKIKVRQWATCPTEDPTVLPDWRAVVVEVLDARDDAEVAAGVAETYRDAAEAAKTAAQAAQGAAANSANAALSQANTATQKAGEASASATAAAGSASSAATAASHYPYIGADGYWYVWENGAFVKKNKAQGDKGDKGDDGAPGSQVSVSPTGTATDEVGYITIDGVEKKLAGGGGGGEPTAYLKDASVVSDTLTITKKDNTQVTFSKEDKAAQTPTFSEAANLDNLLGSGEPQETMWGKVNKAISVLFGKADAVVIGYRSWDTEVTGVIFSRIRFMTYGTIADSCIANPTAIKFLLYRNGKWTGAIDMTVTMQGGVITGTHSLVSVSYLKNGYSMAHATVTIGENTYECNLRSYFIYDTGKAFDSDKLNGKTEAQLMANTPVAYSTTSAYAVGQACVYNNALYVCKTAITSPGEAWTAAHWQLVGGFMPRSGGSDYPMTGPLYLNNSNCYLLGNNDGGGFIWIVANEIAFNDGSSQAGSRLHPDGTDIVTEAKLPYGYNALTPSGEPLAATDGSINILPASASGDAFTINLPYPTSGKVTDVIVRLDCSNLASGATLPAITWACKNAGGTAQTITWRDISGDTVAVGKVYWYCITLYPTGAAGDNTMDGMMAIRELAARA